MVGARSDLHERALDALDVGVLVASADCETILYRNVAAARLLGDGVPPSLCEAARAYVHARRDLRRLPPAVRIDLGEHSVYLRVQASPGDPPLEIIFVRQEVIRDVDLFRVLNARYAVSHREFQILSSLRLGRTNREIASELGIYQGTVARHMHRLLERFDAPNRTRLVNMIESLVPRR
jgi:DNA-binding NarL/FixJ family response regulator